MKIVITGGAGLIGSNLIERLLLRERLQIVAIDEFANWSRPNKIPGAGDFQVQLVTADCASEKYFNHLLGMAKGAKAIVHLAASSSTETSLQEPKSRFQRDTRATHQMLEIARRVGAKRFIFASSASAVVDESPPRPLSLYGTSKVAGEALCSAYYHSFGLETVALRFANVYGERSRHKNSFVARSLSRAIAGESIQVIGDGTQTRDFVHVVDVVDAIARVIMTEREVAGKVFNIGSGISTPINEVATVLIAALSRHGVQASVEPIAARQEVQQVGLDVSRLGQLDGWKPTIGLGEGLDRTTRWFLENTRN